MVSPRSDRRSPSVEALEARLLHSGDGAGAAVSDAGAALASWDAAVQAQAWVAPVQAAQAAQALQGGAGELVVVDARVPDAQRLIAGFEAQREAGRPLRVVVVQADEDGVAAIDAALDEAGGHWSAVHLVGHGEPGELQLGTARIDAGLLRARAGEIAQWSTKLAAGADLLLWGCDSGAGEAGSALLDGLSALTGADVAASTDATGGLAYGGNWVLEASRGRIEAAAPVDAALQASYDGLLAISNVSAGSEVAVRNNTVDIEPASSVTSSTPGRRVATSAAGTLYVWIDPDSGNTTTLRGRFDAPGRTGSVFTIADGNDTTRKAPAVAIDAAGNAIVAWAEVDDEGSQRVRAAYFAPPASAGDAMRRVGNVAYADTAEASTRDDVSVAMSPDGTRAVVVWQITGTGYLDIRAARFALTAPGGGASGSMAALQSSPIAVTDKQGMEDSHPDVAIADDGSGWIVFRSVDTDTPESGYDGIYLVAFDTSGRVPPQSGRFGFTGVRLGVATGSVPLTSPTVAFDADGNGLAVWVSADTPTTSSIRALALDAGGRAVGSAITVGSGTDGLQPSVAAFASGRFALAWSGSIAGGSGRDVLLVEVRVDAGGARTDGDVIRANGNASADQVAPSVSARNGRVVVAWNEPFSNGKARLESRAYDLVPRPVFTRVGTNASLTEGDDSTVAFDVTLSAAPVTDLVLDLSLTRPGQVQVSTARLVFTSTNWNQPQRVTLSAIDDTVVDGTVPVGLQAAVGGTVQASAAIDVIDNDVANVFTVTTNADTSLFPPGPVSPLMLYERSLAGQPISLRDAIRAANFAGTSTASAQVPADRIRFALPAGRERIVLTEALDPIVSAVDIDGGNAADGRPNVELLLPRTGYTGSGINLLTLAAGSDGSRIAGLAIGGGWDGIEIQTASNVIENCWIGVGRDGSIDPASPFRNRLRGISVTDAGVPVVGAQANNVIRNALIANNAEGGIRLLGTGADFTTVVGNRIEGNGFGTPDAGYGILLTNNSDAALIGGDPATSPERMNLIRNNGAYGIFVTDSSGYDWIVGNTISGHGRAVRVDWSKAPAAPTVSVSSASPAEAGGSTVAVEVSARAGAGQAVRIDFYAGSRDADMAWIASTTLTADGSGRATGRVSLQVASATPFLSAVASSDVKVSGSKMWTTSSGASDAVKIEPAAAAAPAAGMVAPQQAKPASGPSSMSMSLSLAADGGPASANAAGATAASAQATGTSATTSAAAAGASTAQAGDAPARVGSAASSVAQSVSSAGAAASPTGTATASTGSATASTGPTAVAGVRAVAAAQGPAAAGFSFAAPAVAANATTAPSADAAASRGAAAEGALAAGGAHASIGDGTGPNRGAGAPGGDAVRRGGPAVGIERLRTETTVAGSATAALRDTDYAEAIQQTRQEAVAQFEMRTVLATSSVMLGTSLSIGYAVWMARGGVLLTSLLASMPAWRSIDPLPVLARTDARGRDDEGEDDSLRGLLARAAERGEGAEDAPDAPVPPAPQAEPA